VIRLVVPDAHHAAPGNGEHYRNQQDDQRQLEGKRFHATLLWLQWRYGRKLESDNLFFRHLSGIKATAEFRIVLPFLETGNAPPDFHRLSRCQSPSRDEKIRLQYVSH
jgi:hypothetical protein